MFPIQASGDRAGKRELLYHPPVATVPSSSVARLGLAVTSLVLPLLLGQQGKQQWQEGVGEFSPALRTFKKFLEIPENGLPTSVRAEEAGK